MPGINIGMYLTTEEYLIYSKNRTELNKKASDNLKEEIGKVKK